MTTDLQHCQHSPIALTSTARGMLYDRKMISRYELNQVYNGVNCQRLTGSECTGRALQYTHSQEGVLQACVYPE
jgi:hypothetical protein